MSTHNFFLRSLSKNSRGCIAVKYKLTDTAIAKFDGGYAAFHIERREPNNDGLFDTP